jgi:hypothetical protein
MVRENDIRPEIPQGLDEFGPADHDLLLELEFCFSQDPVNQFRIGSKIFQMQDF